MVDTEELMPCPECGSRPEVKAWGNGYIVECLVCHSCLGDEFKEDATGCFEPFDSVEQAIAGWNYYTELWV
ncbi:MAG: Lar family restriction alleviation protein [Synergistaceae bacterium]|nr:Lar family restriction alleviation protein [Synergistaceae bacterium]